MWKTIKEAWEIVSDMVTDIWETESPFWQRVKIFVAFVLIGLFVIAYTHFVVKKIDKFLSLK